MRRGRAAAGPAPAWRPSQAPPPASRASRLMTMQRRRDLGARHAPSALSPAARTDRRSGPGWAGPWGKEVPAPLRAPVTGGSGPTRAALRGHCRLASRAPGTEPARPARALFVCSPRRSRWARARTARRVRTCALCRGGWCSCRRLSLPNNWPGPGLRLSRRAGSSHRCRHDSGPSALCLQYTCPPGDPCRPSQQVK